MFYAECIDIPGVHIFSKKLHEGGNNEPYKYKNWTIKNWESMHTWFRLRIFMNLSM